MTSRDADRLPRVFDYRNHDMRLLARAMGPMYGIGGLMMVLTSSIVPWGIGLCAGALGVVWMVLGVATFRSARCRLEIRDERLHVVNTWNEHDVPLADVVEFRLGRYRGRNFVGLHARCVAIEVTLRDGSSFFVEYGPSSPTEGPRLMRQLEDLRKGLWPYQPVPATDGGPVADWQTAQPATRQDGEQR